MAERIDPWHLFEQGFLVRGDPHAEGDHWQGGETQHDGAVCPECDRPFWLLWDLNVRDSALQRAADRAFGDWERLPLYFCWPCAGDLAYRIGPGDRLEVVSHVAFEDDEDFPYPGFPRSLPRSRVGLTPIPRDVHKVFLVLHEELEGIDIDDKLTDDARKRVCEFLERDRLWGAGHAWRGQLGGLPYMAQGHEHHLCPAPSCGVPTRELASIPNDPLNGMPMNESVEELQREFEKDVAFARETDDEPPTEPSANHWIQVSFQICPQCRTILALNRCD